VLCLHYKKLINVSREHQGEDDEDEQQVNVAFEANAFHTYQVNAIGYQGLKSTEVLLDNQADISIIRPDLLQCLEDAKRELRVLEVGGAQSTMKTTEYFDHFFHVYTSKDMKANILCFADVEDTYDITCVPREHFTVYLPDRDIVFHRCDELYIADFAQQNIVHTTRVYTKVEVEQAWTNL
jgi:hypothetical protein